MSLDPEELAAIRARVEDTTPMVTPLNSRGMQAWLDREALLLYVDVLRTALELAFTRMNEHQHRQDQEDK